LVTKVSLYIVSDLHIWGPQDPLYSSLLALLRERAFKGDIIVLAGDIFDLLVGDKEIFYRKYQEFLETMADAGQRGIQIHYIEGNHDFLFQKLFQNMAGVTVHNRDLKVEIEGKKFFLAHGDLVDPHDYGYMILRALFRSIFMRLFVALMPGLWLDNFGRFLSRRSRMSNKLLPSQLPLERREHLRKLYRNFAAERMTEGYDFVVMGHCHDLDEMHFKIGSRHGQYINVGFPRVHGSFLCWTPGEGKMHREKLPHWIF